jgi:membrane-bound lytic murein transglycosylase A
MFNYLFQGSSRGIPSSFLSFFEGHKKIKSPIRQVEGFLTTSFISAVFLTGCQIQPVKEISLEPVDYEKLPGWKKEQLMESLPAIKKSCSALLKRPGSSDLPTSRNWQPFCRGLVKEKISESRLRAYFVTHLQPYRVRSGYDTIGKMTGYYEPELRGSRRRHGKYQTPLYRLPGKGINKNIPRSRIVAGALKNKNLEIVWVDDPIDSFFLQIQGSGRVKLDTGGVLRLGYAGANGHPYTPIGKILVEKGELSLQDVSMQTIRQWLKQHPTQAEKIMSQNESYVFFQERQGDGPIGSQGVALTPHRSLAVDRSYYPLGTLMWINAQHPNIGERRLQKLMVAQDTGGAIKGVLRADYFWGNGHEAADLAGRMNSQTEIYVLLPK